MSWGCFIEKGGPPKGWYFGFPTFFLSRKQAEEFAQIVCATVFIWVGVFWGGLPSLE